jgi:BTB/POZ domain-containing protein KCTD9
MTTLRLSYEDSCVRLQSRYLEKGIIPAIPDHMPAYDDPGPLGVNFFRTFVGDGEDLRNLTLPRTFFGRSELSNVSFENTDLSESNLCWNDFIDVDFTDAVLAGSDLRASNYERVKFIRSNLSGVDMRLSSFRNCEFAGANMTRAIMTRAQAAKLTLSGDQQRVIDWAEEDGPEPSGG